MRHSQRSWPTSRRSMSTPSSTRPTAAWRPGGGVAARSIERPARNWRARARSWRPVRRATRASRPGFRSAGALRHPRRRAGVAGRPGGRTRSSWRRRTARSLELARDHTLTSIAFPRHQHGHLRVSARRRTHVAVTTVRAFAPRARRRSTHVDLRLLQRRSDSKAYASEGVEGGWP